MSMSVLILDVASVYRVSNSPGQKSLDGERESSRE